MPSDKTELRVDAPAQFLAALDVKGFALHAPSVSSWALDVIPNGSQRLGGRANG